MTNNEKFEIQGYLYKITLDLFNQLRFYTTQLENEILLINEKTKYYNDATNETILKTIYKEAMQQYDKQKIKEETIEKEKEMMWQKAMKGKSKNE